MAKKWGKRKKARSPVVMPGALESGGFAASRPSRPARPASSTPLADYLARGHPGVDDGYVVLPRSLAEGMPLPWQQQMAGLLARFHEAHGEVSWPSYRVVPSRPERLVDLDEEQLAEAGYLVEIDSGGELVYRERSGRRVADPENTVALVPCLDPIVRGTVESGGGARTSGAAATAEDESTGTGPGHPAPMNIGPQPVWETTARPARSAEAPPLPPPPTAPSLSTPAPGSVPGGGTAAGAPVPAAPGSGSEVPGAEVTRAAGARVDVPGSGGPDVDGTGSERTGDEASGDEGIGEGIGDDEPGDGSVPGGFGPTGDEPTEIPYRYRR